MALLENITAAFSEFNTQKSVETIKNKAFQNFQNIGFPTKKDEEWKYTSLRTLVKSDFKVSKQLEASITEKDVKDYSVEALDSYKLVFVNNQFQPQLSDTSEEYQFKLLSEVFDDEVYQATISEKFGKLSNGFNSMSDLNTAFSLYGVFIEVAKSKAVSKPIEIVYFSTGSNDDGLFAQPRNLFVLHQNAQVKIIERHQSLTENPVFTNVVTEVYQEKDSIFDLYKIQNDKLNTSIVDSTFVEQQGNTNANVYTFSLGGNIVRNNLTFIQNGTHSDSKMNGISILEGNQFVDNHTLVKHNAPDCTSNETYKGVYDENSTGVFNGKVIVDRLAQRLDAYQQNDSVLLTDTATVSSKPQLEIFADDVRCSHGCTIGQLDDSSLF